jgi:membrane protein DedA with SNARE-associated domain
VLRISYPVFAASVAVSTAIWAGVVMAIGINFGPRMEAFLRVHREMYVLWAAVVLVMILFIVRSSLRASHRTVPNRQEP